MEADLWQRLVSGDCARVLVIGPDPNQSMLGLYFPQTLGLPPISYAPYRYHPDGTFRTPAELAETADRLAAEDRWIVEWLPWAEAFMARAEAIISIETVRAALASRRDPLIDVGVVLKLPWRAVKKLRKRAAQRRSGEAGPVLDFDAPLFPLRGPRWSPAVSVAMHDYPEKLVRVTDAWQIRELRAVRASRPSAQ